MNNDFQNMLDEDFEDEEWDEKEEYFGLKWVADGAESFDDVARVLRGWADLLERYRDRGCTFQGPVDGGMFRALAPADDPDFWQRENEASSES